MSIKSHYYPKKSEFQAERLQKIERAIAPLIERLLTHKVYQKLTTASALRIFLEHHCYAVWDFMCLLKSLQQKLTVVSVPWSIPNNIQAARMINEIVLVEETDIARDGFSYASHFQIYLEAMDEVRASTKSIQNFVSLLEKGITYHEAVIIAGVPEIAARFVTQTLQVCRFRTDCEIASYFLFGRENLIPDLFRKIVCSLSIAEGVKVDSLLYYLDRHIGIDEEEHKPASKRILVSLCGDSDYSWQLAHNAAIEALESRLALWDGIAQAID